MAGNPRHAAQHSTISRLPAKPIRQAGSAKSKETSRSCPEDSKHD
jgi:hypothetical protein